MLPTEKKKKRDSKKDHQVDAKMQKEQASVPKDKDGSGGKKKKKEICMSKRIPVLKPM